MAFLACGGGSSSDGGGSSPDVCQQDVTFLEAHSSKYNSCVPDAGDAGAVDLDAGLQGCEVALRSCDGGDLKLLNSELACQQALSSSVKCQWYTEADPQADTSYYAYTQARIACGMELAKIPNATCANALPPLVALP